MSAHSSLGPAEPDQPTRRAPGRRRSQGLLDQKLLESVRESVMADAAPVTPSRVAAAVQASGRLLGTAGALAAVESISAELNGLGPLQPLTRDPAVTDIFVNGPDSVWLDRGGGLEKAQVLFSGEPQVRALAARLVAAGGRRLDDGSPCVDVRLDGGYRVHAVLPPISTAGTLLSVRIRRATVFSMAELRRDGMFGTGKSGTLVQSVLERLVESRLSFLISGATGSGKTTLLGTLLGLCHPGERLVLIEDAAELNPVHPHVVSLESRHGNLEGGGAVDLGELVRQALRMRPDRLVVGECRGPEVRELLSAMNTGHKGGGGTIHANEAAAVPARLAALGALAGMGQDAVRLQVASAIDAVVHVERTGTGRQIASIGIMEAQDSGLAVTVALELLRGQLRFGRAWPRLAHRLGMDPGLSGGGVSEPSGALPAGRPPGSRKCGPAVMALAMTALLVIVLVLALWLALPSPGAAGHRIRRALQGGGTQDSAEHGQPRSGPQGPLRGIGRRAVSGLGGLRGGGSAGAGSVPMTVVVQQLAALLKGGRIPARLWDELWILYGGDAARGRAAVRLAVHGAGRDGTHEVPGPVLSPESLRVLAAARAAALRGSSVAAAIRREVAGESASDGTVVAVARRSVSVRAGRDLRVWGELAACFDTAEASGCPLADVLARFAAHLETEDDAEAARKSALAGPRATVRLLTWLPLSGLGLGLLLGVDPVATLLGNPWGLAALAAGVVLTAAGRLWSSRLVRAAAGTPS